MVQCPISRQAATTNRAPRALVFLPLCTRGDERNELTLPSNCIAEGSSLYHDFLQREFSDENLEFWQAVEDYKTTKPKDMAAKAQQIYKDYLTVHQSSKKQQVYVFVSPLFRFDFVMLFISGQSGCGDEIHHASQRPVEQS